MIIELLGLPGSGKTYYTKKFAQEYEMEAISFNKGFKKKFYAILFIIFHPFLFGILIKKLFIENRQDKKVLKHKLFNYLPGVIAREQKGRLSRRSVIDEGLIQFILAMYERKISKKDLRWCQSYFNKRFKIFIIETEEKIRQKRIQTRGRIPRGHLGIDYVNNWMKILEHNYLIYKDFIQDNFQSKIIKNNLR